MNSKERLKDYIETDPIYEEWISDKLKNPSDFDKYCIQHCEDIDILLLENKLLRTKLDTIDTALDDTLIGKIIRKAKPFYRYQENGIKKEIKTKIDRAIDFIEDNWIRYEDAKLYKRKADELEISIEDIYELLKILKGE